MASATAFRNHAINMTQRGFTLIELMIVVVIIGLLTAITLPNYIDYVRNTKITEATSMLADLRIRMEQYYQDNRTYVGGLCTPSAGMSKYFAYTCVSDVNTYTITANGVPSEGMSGYTYSINHSNLKTSSLPDGSSGNCWLTKKGTTC